MTDKKVWLVTGAGRGMGIDLAIPLDDVAAGYRAMDERRAIKTLLQL